jgi:hypothetical protein
MTIDDSILKEFVLESKSLISESLEILEEVESDISKVKRLEVYGNNVDRIMGGAKNLAIMAEKDHPLHFIGDYCALCKAVGYKSAQIMSNEDFLMICVALLLDATEMLKEMIEKLATSKVERTKLNQTFLDRLQWVSSQFGKDVRETVGKQGLAQDDIDDLLKKLGIG